MRRSIVVLVVLVALAAGAFLWVKGRDASLELASGTPLEALVPKGQRGLHLEGRILDATGAAVANAEVSLAPSALPVLRELRDADQGRLLIHGASAGQAQVLADRLAKGEGDFPPVATTRTDAEGRFRFDGLRNVALRVWVASDTHGPIEQDHVIPGESLELTVPAAHVREVRVVDEQEKPLAKARVWLLSSAHPQARGFESDDEGRVRLTQLGDGAPTLLFAPEGFVPRIVRAEVRGVEVTVAAMEPVRSLDIEVFAKGAPVDATILLEAIDDGAATSTSRHAATDGRVKVEGLIAPRALVRAVAGETASAPVLVSLDARERKVSLHLTEAARLRVAPFDLDGRALNGSRVTLLRTDGLAVERSEGAGPHGLGPVAPGVYAVRIEAAGARSFEGLVRLPKGESSIDVALDPQQVMTGTVVDGFGRPVAGARITSTPLETEAKSDETGRFRLELPAEGIYTLHAHHAAWGAARMTHAAPADGVTLTLQPGATVRVQVEAPGQAAEGAEVRVSADGAEAMGRTNADGVALIRGLPSGEVRIEVRDPSAAGSSSAAVRATLKEGTTEQLTVSFTAHRAQVPTSSPVVSATPAKGATSAVRYRGRIALADGAPLHLYSANGVEFTDPSGQFELPVRASDAEGVALSRFLFRAPGYVAIDGYRVSDTLDLGAIELLPIPVIHGTVADADGAPISGAIVGCEGCPNEVLSLHDGSFAIEARTPTLNVFASKGRKYARVQAQVGKPAALTLGEAVGLRGTLHGADGKPENGVPLRLRGQGREETRFTGPDGSFDFASGVGSFWLSRPASGTAVVHADRLVSTAGPSERSLGRAPGTGWLAVHADSNDCWNLGLIAGSVPPASPLQERLALVEGARFGTMKAGADTLFEGLAPGAYALRFEPTAKGRAAETAQVTILAGEETRLQAPDCGRVR